MGDSQLGDIVEPLLAWYDAHARVLPWREHPAPYRVWVSEIMLQQTRVEAVKPYFARFMECFPTVQALAECEEEELFKYWEGLGYYSRARNLKKAAKIIVSQYGGELPADRRALLALPGIGSYTAGAIGSIAFGLPVPAVDGKCHAGPFESCRKLRRYLKTSGKEEDRSCGRRGLKDTQKRMSQEISTRRSSRPEPSSASPMVPLSAIFHVHSIRYARREKET